MIARRYFRCRPTSDRNRTRFRTLRRHRSSVTHMRGGEQSQRMRVSASRIRPASQPARICLALEGSCARRETGGARLVLLDALLVKLALLLGGGVLVLLVLGHK